MNLDRRDFIKVMIAAASAPAIVKAENIMKIVVPDKKIIVPDSMSEITLFSVENFIVTRSTIKVKNNMFIAPGDIISITIPGERPRPMEVERIVNRFAFKEKQNAFTRIEEKINNRIEEIYGTSSIIIPI